MNTALNGADKYFCHVKALVLLSLVTKGGSDSELFNGTQDRIIQLAGTVSRKTLASSALPTLRSSPYAVITTSDFLMMY